MEYIYTRIFHGVKLYLTVDGWTTDEKKATHFTVEQSYALRFLEPREGTLTPRDYV
jgi:hypothetical protein